MIKYRTYPAQKGALTKAINSGSAKAVLDECVRVVRTDWSKQSPYTPYWPDGWHTWQRALDDAYPASAPRLEDLQ